MFQRAIRLRQAEEALARGLWEEALRLASDPRIAEHRRAAQVRRKAREALLARARHRMERGNLPGARRDLERAGGDATLGEALKAAMGRADREKKLEREKLEKARFFLRAGLPGRVAALLEGVGSADAQTLLDLSRQALAEGDRKAERARVLLERGDFAGALGEWREARRSNREKAPPEGILQAFLDRVFPGGESPDVVEWDVWSRRLEEDPWSLEFREVRERMEALARRALDSARLLLERGEPEGAGRILDGLERLPLAGGTFENLLELQAWREGLHLFRSGRKAEAAGLVREGCSSHPEALRQLGPEGEKEPESRAAPALTRLLGAGEAGEFPEELVRNLLWAREDLDREIEALRESSEEDLKEGFRLLDEGFPLQAFRSFLQVRIGREERERGIREALGRMRRAREKLGTWRARLARLDGGAGCAGMETLLEEAGRLDREAPGLRDALDQGGKAREFLALLEETGPEIPLGDAIRRFCRDLSLPPGGARTLRRLGRFRVESLSRRALEEGAGAERARMLGAAREAWGLPPDPAFPLLSKEAGAARGGAASNRGNPMDGFFLRVAGRGDLLVLPRDGFVLGSAAGGKADLPVLAGIGAREAEFTRRLRFHEGISFHVRSLSGRPLVLDGESLEEGSLRDGATLAVGPALKIRFRRPRKDSSTVLLEFPGDFDVEGCRKVAWMKAPGWDGALVLGPEEDSHVRIPGAGVRLEISLDGRGRIVIRSTENIEFGEDLLGKEAILPCFGPVRSGDLLLFLDPRHPSRAGTE